MDRFWCSRCLKDCIKVSDMMILFAGGAKTPLVVKIRTKQPWVKIKYSCNFDRDFALFRGKIWLWLFYNLFCVTVLKFYTKNLKSFRPKMKAWQQFLRFLILKWKICATFIAILHYLEAKFDYCFFIFVLHYCSKNLHKKIQVISTKNEGMTAIFPNFDFILNQENQHHALFFARNDLNFFV